MTFAVRQINLQFSGGSQTLNLQGLKCIAVISNAGGNVAWGQLQLKVYGMTLDQMNLYSGNNPASAVLNNFQVTVSAGNEGSALNQVFEGGIIKSYIDFSALPDVSFMVSASTGAYFKASPAASFQSSGAKTAQSIISALAPQAGLSVVDNTTKLISLQNQYLSGSLIDQILTVSKIATIPVSIENNIVTMWDNDGHKTTTSVNVNPSTGMVGYPSYYDAGIIVKSEYNQNLTYGTQVNLTSSIAKSNGTYSIVTATHDLSTLTPDGAWFTTIQLAQGYFLAKN